MRTRRLAPLISLPVMLLAIAGCSPEPYVDPEPPRFDTSMNELRSAGVEGLDEIESNFEVTNDDFDQNQYIYPCDGEADDIGRTINMRVFAAANVDSGAESVKENFASSLTDSGQGRKDIEYADGTTTLVSNNYILLENEVGSFLIDYQRAEDGSGVVSIINRTACGVLR